MQAPSNNEPPLHVVCVYAVSMRGRRLLGRALAVVVLLLHCSSTCTVPCCGTVPRGVTVHPGGGGPRALRRIRVTCRSVASVTCALASMDTNAAEFQVITFESTSPLRVLGAVRKAAPPKIGDGDTDAAVARFLRNAVHAVPPAQPLVRGHTQCMAQLWRALQPTADGAHVPACIAWAATLDRVKSQIADIVGRARVHPLCLDRLAHTGPPALYTAALCQLDAEGIAKNDLHSAPAAIVRAARRVMDLINTLRAFVAWLAAPAGCAAAATLRRVPRICSGAWTAAPPSNKANPPALPETSCSSPSSLSSVVSSAE